MALNMSGRGFGWELGVDDKATPVLNNFIGAMAASPSRIAPLLGMFGRLGGGATSIAASAGSAATAVGGLAAALGPLAIAIGVAITAFMTFNDIAMRAEATIQSSIDTFARYETGLAEVSTIIRGTKKEIEGVGIEARKMAKIFGTDVEQQLKGTYQAASAGFSNAADAATVMDTANRLAVAGITDVRSSVTLLAQILNGYVMQADQAQDVSDMLFLTVEKGVTTVPQLAAAFGKVVPSAAAVGAPLEEVLAALAALTRGGLSTAESVTALARMFDFLRQPPEKARKILEKYVGDLDQLDIRSRGVLPVMQDLAKVFEENERALDELGAPVRAFRALMPLTTTQVGTFTEILGDMENRLGATDRAFGIQMRTIDKQRARWAAFVEDFKAGIGQTFAPFTHLALTLLEKLSDLISGLPQPLQKLIFSIVALGLSLPVVAKHGLGLVWSLIKLAVAAGLLVSILTVLGPTLVTIGVLMAPLIAISAALFAAWKINFMGIRDTVVMVWKRIKLTFEAVAAFIRGGGIISGPLAEELAKAENTGVLKFAGAIYQIFQRIKVAGTAAWKAIKEAINGVIPVLEEMFPSIKPIVDALFRTSDASVDLEKKLPIEKFREFGKTIGENIGKVIRFAVGLTRWIQKEMIPAIGRAWTYLKILWRIGAFVFNAINRRIQPVILAAELLALAFKKAYDWAFKLGERIGGLGGGLAGAALGAIGFEMPRPMTETEMQVTRLTRVAEMPIMGRGVGGAGAPRRQPGARQPIQINVKSELDVDGDKLGEKMNRFVVDLASAEMIPEPAA